MLPRPKETRAAQDATKHSLNGGPVVLPNESQQEFDALKASYRSQYRPATQSERDLVDEMVEARWRMRRLIHIETALMNDAFERQMEQLGEDADLDRAMALGLVEIANQSKGWRLVERYQRTLRRSYERAMLELKQSQENRANQPDEQIRQPEEHIELPNEPKPEADYSVLRVNHENHRALNAVLPYLAKQNEPPLRRAAA